MPAAGVVMIIAVVLIVAAVVFYLSSTIVALRRDHDRPGRGDRRRRRGSSRRRPRSSDVVTDINQNLDAGVDLLEGLLVKKAGLDDAVGLVDGLYPGAAADGLRNFPDSKTVTPRGSPRSTRRGR